jgi:hypothetical protein
MTVSPRVGPLVHRSVQRRPDSLGWILGPSTI